MALNELYARRLATLVTLIEDAIERIERILTKQSALLDAGLPSVRLTHAQIDQAHQHLQVMRRHVRELADRFNVQRRTPEPQQVIAAELSSLWVMLENSLPEQMKGYGREFAPDDRKDWEQHVRALLQDTERIRQAALHSENP